MTSVRFIDHGLPARTLALGFVGLDLRLGKFNTSKVYDPELGDGTKFLLFGETVLDEEQIDYFYEFGPMKFGQFTSIKAPFRPLIGMVKVEYEDSPLGRRLKVVDIFLYSRENSIGSKIFNHPWKAEFSWGTIGEINIRLISEESMAELLK